MQLYDLSIWLNQIKESHWAFRLNGNGIFYGDKGFYQPSDLATHDQRDIMIVRELPMSRKMYDLIKYSLYTKLRSSFMEYISKIDDLVTMLSFPELPVLQHYDYPLMLYSAEIAFLQATGISIPLRIISVEIVVPV